MDLLGTVNWPVYNRSEHELILKQLREKALKNIEGNNFFFKRVETKVSVIGSDISFNQLEAGRENMAKMNAEHNLNLLKSAEDYNFSISPNFEILQFGEYLKLVNCNFWQIPDTLNSDLEGYDIFTNPPFSPLKYLQDQKMLENKNLKALEGDVTNFYERMAKRAIALEKKYQNFDKFLYKHKKELGSVHIVYPLRLQRTKYHFVAESDLSWDCTHTFFSGGFKLGLWEWNKNLKSEEKLFFDFTKNFLNRRKDLHGSENVVIAEELNNNLEGTPFQGSRHIETLINTWRMGKEDWADLNPNQKLSDQKDIKKRFKGVEEGTLDIREKFEISNQSEKVVDLANLAKGDHEKPFLASMEWNNKIEKAIILDERRKRRNSYLKRIKEEGESERMEKAKKIGQRRKARLKGFEAKLKNMGVLSEDFEKIEKRIIGEGKKKKKRVQDRRKERDWSHVNKNYKRW